MNNNAKKWVEALRSGEYKQGKGALRNGDQFCCLGVACELAIKDGVKLNVELSENGITGYDLCIGHLPTKVASWLNLNSSYGQYDEDKYLTNNNDSGGMSFEQIADIIESEPSGLFAD